MRLWVLFGLAAGVGLVGGCTPAERAGVREDVRGMRQQVGNAAESARQAAADASLEAKVKTALSTRKGLDDPKARIDVEAKEGHVVLKGDVNTREQAELAERVALEIEGVTGVDNQLMLRVPAKSTGTVTEPAVPGTSTPGTP